jgi:hypothetical protein
LTTPRSADRRTPALALRLIVMLWLVGAAAMVASGLATGFEPVNVVLSRAGLMAALGVIFSLGLWRVAAAPGRPLPKIAWMCLAVVAAVALHTAIDIHADDGLKALLGVHPPHRRIISDNVLVGLVMGLIATSNVVVFAALYGFIGLAATSLRWSMEAREREAQLAAARTEAISAQLAMLRQQLNPHFVFNTLNAIGSLVASGRGRDAEAMIDKLSDFLRASLGEAEAFASLDEELAMLEAYLEIEAVRFGERLKVAYDLAPDLRGSRVPSYILQPLVETAVKYAVAPALRPVEVRLAARQEGADLVLTVEDSGAGPGAENAPRAPGSGTGLRVIRERLALLYGGRASLKTSPFGEGFLAEIRLPLETSREQPA